MDLFFVQPDIIKWGNSHKSTFNAKHIWMMPGIKCSECKQTWATTGISYPLVDLSLLSTYNQYFNPRPVDIELYLKLFKLVSPLVPDKLIITPGTNFGPIVGKAWGEFGDFVWLNLWTLLIQKEAYLRIYPLKMRLPEVALSKLKSEIHSSLNLLEFQIEAHAHLSQYSYSSLKSDICHLCGRDNRKVERIIIDKTSIPIDLDMFRIRDFPTKILVTERFKGVIENLNMTNISFEKVEISQN